VLSAGQSWCGFRVETFRIEQRLGFDKSSAKGENYVDRCFNFYGLVIDPVRLVAPVPHGIDGGLP